MFFATPLCFICLGGTPQNGVFLHGCSGQEPHIDGGSARLFWVRCVFFVAWSSFSRKGKKNIRISQDDLFEAIFEHMLHLANLTVALKKNEMPF